MLRKSRLGQKNGFLIKKRVYDKVISREKKSMKEKEREYWIRPGHAKQWWLQFLNDEVIADEWK